jgi:hypothetical protein
LGALVDVAALNRPAVRRLARVPPGARDGVEVDCLVVLGYTPRFGWRSTELHSIPDESCARAAEDLATGVADTIIVTGGAVHGPANEAVLMRAALVRRGVPEERILVEPCARHTTTNLRNAGRLMLTHGLRDAYLIAADVAYERPLDWIFHRHWKQAFHVGYPRLSGLGLRFSLALGYWPGTLRWERPWHVRFVPSADCLRESLVPALEGDA